eukprot:3739950-Karenia_brevis.AAC.1
MEFISQCPESKMIRAMQHVVCRDVKDLNDLVFVLRSDARILASVPWIVGMMAYIGPKNCGKSLLNMRLVNFLGDGPQYLAKQTS